MTEYYGRKQVRSSYSVAHGVVVAVLVALLLAAVQSWSHLDDEEDLARLSPQQRAGVMSWYAPIKAALK